MPCREARAGGCAAEEVISHVHEADDKPLPFVERSTIHRSLSGVLPFLFDAHFVFL